MVWMYNTNWLFQFFSLIIFFFKINTIFFEYLIGPQNPSKGARINAAWEAENTVFHNFHIVLSLK